MRAHYGIMSSASYYRTEAQRCRELAANAVQGSIMAERWRTIAAEYETLAKALEAAPDAMRVQGAPLQQQRMQQQQAKTTKTDKEGT